MTATSSNVRLEREPAAVERALERFGIMLRRYFRAETHHMERVPEGAVLLVANHNIGVPWEALSLLQGWHQTFGAERDIYVLSHPLPLRIPWIGMGARRLGAVEATREAADQTIASGASLLVFPGGVREETRPFWQRRRCNFHGRKGWAKIALDSGVPVVPVSIVGSHEINPVLLQSRFIAWLTLMRLVRVSHMPLTVGQVLVTLLAIGLGWLFGAWWVGALIAYAFLSSPFVVFLPLLPSKISVTIGEPIELKPATDAHGDDREARLQAAYELVLDRVQTGVDRLNEQRPGFLG